MKFTRNIYDISALKFSASEASSVSTITTTTP
ncbi:hypothetical protein ABID34_003610 [Chryseobacterium limigenitum]